MSRWRVELNIRSLYKGISTPFRRRRMEAFERRFAITDETTILDVGGAPGTWELIKTEPQITLLNLSLPSSPAPAHIQSMVGDGTALPFRDKSFDIVFSNSVIEHLYNKENQLRFAGEVRRVGKAYSVQSPNRNFPIEPHYLAPGVHFLPKAWQRRLVRNFTITGWIVRPSQAHCNQMIDEIRLLRRAELELLFPESNIVSERILGVSKSFTAEYMG